jgi:hypothetical protein
LGQIKIAFNKTDDLLKEKDHDMALKMQVLPWDRHKYVVGLNRLMGSQHFPLDN